MFTLNDLIFIHFYGKAWWIGCPLIWPSVFITLVTVIHIVSWDKDICAQLAVYKNLIFMWRYLIFMWRYLIFTWRLTLWPALNLYTSFRSLKGMQWTFGNHDISMVHLVQQSLRWCLQFIRSRRLEECPTVVIYVLRCLIYLPADNVHCDWIAIIVITWQDGSRKTWYLHQWNKRSSLSVLSL